MKFYNSVGPNPRVVRMFMQEKDITLPMQDIDLRGGENREDGYLQKNPFGQMPALELDDGSILTEVTAICEYLDEKYPGDSLIGTTPEERAATRMWTRRVDLYIVEPMLNGYRFDEALKFFTPRMRVMPQASDDLKALAHEKLDLLEKLMADQSYLAGDRYSLADLFLYCMVDFAANVGQPLDPAWLNLKAWFDRVAERPSAAASK